MTVWKKDALFKINYVLVRSRFHPVILCDEIEKAFFEIWSLIGESDRDCLRFHLVEASNNDKTEIYHFARLVLGLTWRPFILEGTLDVHIENCGQEFREAVKKSKR